MSVEGSQMSGDAALEWAVARLGESGLSLTAEPMEVKDRPWSRVVRLTASDGTYWLKVNRGATTYEPALLSFLASVAPETVDAPLAIEGPWSLQRDGGPTLRDLRGEESPSLDGMVEVMREYAALQRTTASHVDELIAIGVPDLRPERLPDELDALLERQLDGLSDEAYQRLRAFRPTFAQRCSRLASSPIPSTLQHDDLHDNNVFATGTTYRIFDWGDASVAHPFATLLVSLPSFARQSGTTVDDPQVISLRDAYLACWTDLAPTDELLEEARLAVSVAPIGRSLAWQRSLVDAAEADVEEWGENIPGWLEDLLL